MMRILFEQYLGDESYYDTTEAHFFPISPFLKA